VLSNKFKDFKVTTLQYVNESTSNYYLLPERHNYKNLRKQFWDSFDMVQVL